MTHSLNVPRGLPDFSELDISFDIIDSHHHLFGLQHVYYPWLTDHTEPNFLLGNYDSIKVDYLPEDYRRDVGELNVVKTVHVEAEVNRSDALVETHWLHSVMRDCAMPDAIVAHAFLHHRDTPDQLVAQAQCVGVKGIRSKPVTATDAVSRSRVEGVEGSMQDPMWRRGLGNLRDHGLSWDCRVPFWHLREAAEVCELYPDLAVVVEHTGLPWDRSEAGLQEWRIGMQRLAALENVYLKISELGLAADPWDYEDNRRVVLEALELFGFNRCMFASNYPVAGLRIGYVDQLCAIAHMVRDCSREQRDQLFHDTAMAFYRLEE